MALPSVQGLGRFICAESLSVRDLLAEKAQREAQWWASHNARKAAEEAAAKAQADAAWAAREALEAAEQARLEREAVEFEAAQAIAATERRAALYTDGALL